MLGSPHRGSFTIPLVLLGREETVRKLALLDMTQSREAILEIVSGYQGLLELLPNTGNLPLFRPDTWDELHGVEGGWSRPDPDHLAEAERVRELLSEVRFDPGRVCYVAGHGWRTPSGIRLDPEAYKATLVDAYLKVADQHNQAGTLEKYIEYLEMAVAESPRTASLHLTLGNACEEAQMHDKAVAQWRMVLDLEPDHPRRMELLNLIAKYAGVGAAAEPKAEEEA